MGVAEASKADLLGGSISAHNTHEFARLQDFASCVDQAFFERWPDRSHRVRRAFAGEAAGVSARPGRRLFVAVRQVRIGVRLRLIFEGRPDGETDLPESAARECFEFMASHVGRLRRVIASISEAKQ
jgi:hypothetical protein